MCAFRRSLREIVFAKHNNDGLWKVSDGRWPTRASTEFSRITSWFLDQPFELSQSDLSARARPQLKTTLRLIENPDQGRVFERWCLALGLGGTIFGDLLPDPVLAIEEELPESTGDAEELPALTFRDRLLERLPTLTGGAYTEGLDSGAESRSAARPARGRRQPHEGTSASGETRSGRVCLTFRR